MKCGTVSVQASLQASQVISRGQLERRRQAFDIEDGLLQVLWPHGFQFSIEFGHGLDDSPIVDAGKL